MNRRHNLDPQGHNLPGMFCPSRQKLPEQAAIFAG